MKRNAFYIGLVLTLLNLTFLNPLFAQQIQVLHLDDIATISFDSNQNSPEVLTMGIVPTLFLKNGELASGSDVSITAKRIISDAASIDLLKSENPEFSEVEIIQFKFLNMEELNLLQEISTFKHFEKLKYIYVSCAFNLCDSSTEIGCEKQILKDLLSPSTQNGMIAIYSTDFDE